MGEMGWWGHLALGSSWGGVQGSLMTPQGKLSYGEEDHSSFIKACRLQVLLPSLRCVDYRDPLGRLWDLGTELCL